MQVNTEQTSKLSLRTLSCFQNSDCRTQDTCITIWHLSQRSCYLATTPPLVTSAPLLIQTRLHQSWHIFQQPQTPNRPISLWPTQTWVYYCNKFWPILGAIKEIKANPPHDPLSEDNLTQAPREVNNLSLYSCLIPKNSQLKSSITPVWKCLPL